MNLLPFYPECDMKHVTSDQTVLRCEGRQVSQVDLQTRKERRKQATVYRQTRAMDQRDVQQELEDQFNRVLARQKLFQSDWDIAAFAVFFIFIGMVLLLVILVLIRCCCCCCCDDEKPRRRKVGIENMALEH